MVMGCDDKSSLVGELACSPTNKCNEGLSTLGLVPTIWGTFQVMGGGEVWSDPPRFQLFHFQTTFGVETSDI